jgi:predicted amidohydrolase
MVAELGDVDANLAMAERLVRVAFERGANCVILPELFSSGNAFFPHMASATRAINGPPAEVLLELAREGNATTATMPTTIQNAAAIVWRWRAPWCSLIAMCRMSASLGLGSPPDAVTVVARPAQRVVEGEALVQTPERREGCPIWGDGDPCHCHRLGASPGRSVP